MRNNLIRKSKCFFLMILVAACLNGCMIEASKVESEVPVQEKLEVCEEKEPESEENIKKSPVLELKREEVEPEISEEQIEAALSDFEEYLKEIEKEPVVQQQKKENGFDRAKAEQAFAKVNEKRAENGISELAWNESLYELACARAQEIVSHFSHERPDGSYIGDVMLSQYGASGCGENIASNYTSVTNLINGWLNSQGHKENMLDGRFTSGVMGCYCHDGSYYWVNLFQQ